MLCSGGALASRLSQSGLGLGVFWGALCLFFLDMMAGAIVSADQGCSGVCYNGATLVGWLGLSWPRGLGFTGVVGWLWHLDPILIYQIKLKMECKPWCSPAPLTQSSSNYSVIWGSSGAVSFIF